MTQDNVPIDPSSDPNDLQPQPANTPAAKAPPPKRKRRWIRRIILGIVVIVLILLVIVALTPAMLSSGAGRTFVLGKVNDNLNGHVTIADWSIGWTGGIHADDVKVFDENNRQILQIPKFTTQLSLLGAIRGKIHLGKTSIEGLDFFAERMSDGMLNFSRLAKSQPHEEKTENTHSESAKVEDAGRLPSIDGEIELIGCRGTFQDDQNPDKSHRAVEFRTIAGDVKITSINDPIENSLQIVAYTGEGSQLASFSTSGKMQIAGDNRMLTPGLMKIEQKVDAGADDLQHVDQVLGAMLPVHFTSGKIAASIQIHNGADGITVTPLIDGSNIGYIKDGIADSFGAIHVDGAVNLVSPAISGSNAAVTNVQLSSLRVMGVGSAVVLNGSLNDLENLRKFNNVTVSLTYNLGMLFDAVKPWLTKEQKESLKGIIVSGNDTKQFVINGSLPADKPFNEAIRNLTASGEFAVAHFEGDGATLNSLVIPIALADGKVRVAYAGKSAGQEFAPPADLNGGKFSLAGATVDLTSPDHNLDFPDGSQFLVNVGLNPLFTSTFLGGNPMFADAHKSSGLLSITINHCEKFPLDDLATRDVPGNQGVMNMNLKIDKLEIGNVLWAKIGDQLNATKLPFVNKLSLNSVSGDIDDFNVVIQHGVSTQHLTLKFGAGKRPLKLGGTVTLATQLMNMEMDIPLALFGIKAGTDGGIVLPLSGPVNQPQFDLGRALKKNLTNIPGVPSQIQNLLGGHGDNATTQPADATDTIGNLLNGLGKKKDKQ